MASEKITSFESLIVWQEAQNLAVSVYTVTKFFPKDELYTLTSQLRRASSSISANIAEGFGRVSVNDKLHFYTMAYGSLLEVKNFLYLAERLAYIERDVLDTIVDEITKCQKLLNAFKRGLANGQ